MKRFIVVSIPLLLMHVSFAHLHSNIEGECKTPNVIQRDKPIGIDPVEALYQPMTQGAYGICYACAAKASLEYCSRACPLEILDIVAKSNHGNLKEGGYPWITQHQIKYKYNNNVAEVYPISNYERKSVETEGYYYNKNDCLSPVSALEKKDFHKIINHFLEDNSKTVKEVNIPEYNVFIEEIDDSFIIEKFLEDHFNKKPTYPINMSYCTSLDSEKSENCNSLRSHHVVTLYQIRQVCCKHPNNTQSCQKEIHLANSDGQDPQWVLLHPFEKTLKNAHFMSSFSWTEPCTPVSKWKGDEEIGKSKCSPIPIGKDPAFYLALAGDKVNLEKYLEANPAVDISSPRRNWGGMNLLHAAAFSGQTDLVKFLLERYKKMGVLEKIMKETHQGGFTPVLQAAVRDHGEVVKLLLENGSPTELGIFDLNDIWNQEGGRSLESLFKIAGLLLEHNCQNGCKWENFETLLWRKDGFYHLFFQRASGLMRREEY